jgi:hypothetical protein
MAEKHTTREQRFIAADNLKTYFTCYVNLVNDNALVRPGIGKGLREYEEKFKREFNLLLGYFGLGKEEVGFK